MNTLSVRAQYAYQICFGVKDVENRTWKTDYRGPMYIHASSEHGSYPDIATLPEELQNQFKELRGMPRGSFKLDALRRFNDLCASCLNFLHINEAEAANMEPKAFKALLRKNSQKFGYPIRAQSIIGRVELYDIVRDYDSPFAIDGQWHWLLRDPVFFAPQIYGIKGKLRLWNFDLQKATDKFIIE